MNNVTSSSTANQSFFQRWPVVRMIDLAIASSTLEEAANELVEYCAHPGRVGTPILASSVNGQVLSMCTSDQRVHDLFSPAKILHCDGQPLVLLSRMFGSRPFPERIATTDLYPVVADLAARRGTTFYLLGGSPDVNRAAVERSLANHAGLKIVGGSHGYLSPEEEKAVVADIAALKPDILWVSLGVPREQEFFARHRDALNGVGVVKTSGGLFDFLAGAKRRAPTLMQQVGLEWLFRVLLEPRRLWFRYLVTNPHALMIIVASLWSNRVPRAAIIRDTMEMNEAVP